MWFFLQTILDSDVRDGYVRLWFLCFGSISNLRVEFYQNHHFVHVVSVRAHGVSVRNDLRAE